MSRRYRAALLLLVAAVGALLTIMIAWTREPNYDGKRLGQWLADLEFDGVADRGARDRAAQAVQAIGTNALPRLTDLLCAQDSLLNKLLMQFTSRLPFIHFQVSSTRRAQERALQGYRVLGKSATVCLPELIRLLDDPRSPAQAKAYIALALGQMGREAHTAIPALRNAASDQNEEVRLNAMLALANIQQNTDTDGPRRK